LNACRTWSCLAGGLVEMKYVKKMGTFFWILFTFDFLLGMLYYAKYFSRFILIAVD
jgi:hypothetical protein